MPHRITAVYELTTTNDPARAAASIAGEQSTGTFVKTPGESADVKERYAARVEAIEPLGAPPPAALPGSRAGALSHVRMTLSWPVETVGLSLPNLMATVAGNLFELKEVAGLKLVDLDLPGDFVTACPGPAFGIEGTRRLSGVAAGPLIGTIIKPSVGLDPEGTAEVVDQLCAGGIDFIKDDELQADGVRCPFDARLAAVSQVLDRHADRTGRRAMYAINLTGEIDDMQRRHDAVAAAGGTCVMVSLNSVGLGGLLALRRHATLPIHAHRNGWGYLGRSANVGWDYRAWHKIWRLAGADHMHVNGLANKFWEPDDSVIASARACIEPIAEGVPHQVMPVFSSGQTVFQAHPTYERLGSVDLIHTAGGGIIGHPDGIAAGVTALRAAWEAAMAGRPLGEAATEIPALAAALKAFGPRPKG